MPAASLLLIAGEPSGDLLAADLVRALGGKLAKEPAGAKPSPSFFGAGGSHMAEAGVELAVDMTRHSVIGLFEALGQYARFRRLLRQLLDLAVQRRPQAIVCVDFSGFNRRFAAAVRRRQRALGISDWNPRIVQYVSPQVWASRPGRAVSMARDIDLLLSILPFEKEWYARRVPKLRVEFVGHPILDRHSSAASAKGQDSIDCSDPLQEAGRGTGVSPVRSGMAVERLPGQAGSTVPLQETRPRSGVQNAKSSLAHSHPVITLLPGSRKSEVARHVPVIAGAMELISRGTPAEFVMVFPNESLLVQAKTLLPASPPANLKLQVGGLGPALQRSTLAIASTGTVTLECAYYRLPTVTLYKTSWGTYQIGRRLVTVPYLSMPNLLAGEEVFPEFVQDAATAENIARASLELLNSGKKREGIRIKLDGVVAALGKPGASDRAADAILGLLSADSRA